MEDSAVRGRARCGSRCRRRARSGESEAAAARAATPRGDEPGCAVACSPGPLRAGVGGPACSSERAAEGKEGSRRQASACRSGRRRTGRQRARRGTSAAGRGRPARPARPRRAGNRCRARRGCSGRPRPRAGARGTHRRGARAGAANGPLSGAKGLLRRDDRERVRRSRCRGCPSGCTMSAQHLTFFACTRAVSERFTTRNDPRSSLSTTRHDAERGLTGTV